MATGPRFRASKIRNLAVLCSAYEYLIFIDADCIPDENFVVMHTKLAKKGFFYREQEFCYLRN